MVSINLNFSNKAFLLLVSAFVLFATLGIVYATIGAVPNPGHALSELQTCGAGQTLVTNAAGTGWECGIGIGQCTLKTASATISTAPLTVLCDAGTTAVGGGCRVNSDNDYFKGSYPSNDSSVKPNGWTCLNFGTADTYTAYVICC